MAKRNEEQFLDDIDEAEAQEEAPMAADVPSPEEEIERLRAERDAFQDKFMRALAEAENARKRAQKDRTEAANYGGSRLARDLLPVYDSLRRALDSITDEQRAIAGPLIEGVELTMRELVKVFEKHGIRIIDPQIGDPFDPQQHEAMFEAPLPGTKAGEIIQVSAQGFILHDRILRPAQVGVSSFKG